MKKENYLKINEVEKLIGIPRSTIHYYLREGLLPPPVKTGKTMAYYNDGHVERLRLIRKLKNDLGLPVRYIKEKVADLATLEIELEQQHLKSPDYDGDLLLSQSPEDRRKNELIRAAIKIFSEKGFYKTKVRDITDSLDMSTGTFYIYFISKEDLFLKAIDGVMDTMLESAAQAIKTEKNYLMRLLLRGELFFKYYSKYSEILNQLRAEMTKDSTWFQDRVQGIYYDLTQPLIREFREAMEQGLVREIDPDLLAYAITGLIETMSFRMTVDNAYTFDRIIEFLMDFIMNGIPVSLDDKQEKQVQMYLERLRNRSS